MSDTEKPDVHSTGPSTNGGGGRWKTWALIVSLAVNVFVAATVIGAGVRHHWHPPRVDVRDVGFGPFTDALSREDRAALRDAFIAAAPDFRDRRREAAEDFSRLAEALRTDPWNPAEVEQVLSRQGQRASERFDLGRRLFLERLGGMSPAARSALADRIESALQMGWRK